MDILAQKWEIDERYSPFEILLADRFIRIAKVNNYGDIDNEEAKKIANWITKLPDMIKILMDSKDPRATELINSNTTRLDDAI